MTHRPADPETLIDPASGTDYVDPITDYLDADLSVSRCGVLADAVRPVPGRILLLDFDGTVCLGEGPVRAYAAAAFAGVPERDRVDLFTQLDRYLRRLAGHGEPLTPDEPSDGYGLVRRLAEPLLGRERLGKAFLHSRNRMVAEDLGVRASGGLADLLRGFAGEVQRVLLTNSPAIGITETLDRIGLGGLFDQVVVGAGKPRRMAEHVESLLSGAAEGERPCRLMSVGDHWFNDVEIPLEHGCATALITTRPSAQHPSHLHGPQFDDLADGIRAWAAGPERFVANRSVRAVRPGGDPRTEPRRA